MDPVVLTVAFALGYLMYRLGLPPLVGFLVAGLCLSGVGYTSTPMLEAASDVGVTLLLFTIGLKLRIRNLVKPEVWAGASLHMALTVAIMGGALFGLGYSGLRFFLAMDMRTALLLAFALSFSSTVFAVKILDEQGRMDSLNGRTAIGVLVIQDILAVIYLTAATGKVPSVMAIGVIALLPVVRKAFLLTMDRIGHGELMVLFGLFAALIAGAHIFDLVRLKPDLGALILGMLMAPHPRAKEMANALMSIKDVLLVGFFLDIGLRGVPGAAGFAAVGILVALLPLKMALYFLVFTRFRLKARTSFMTMANLSNYSEFGLIVCSLAASVGRLDPRWLVVMAIALSVSFILASPLNTYSDRLFDRLAYMLKRCETCERHPEEAPYERKSADIVVIGMGRTGVGAYDWFRAKYGEVVLGIDYDKETVAGHEMQGRSIVQADVTDLDFWRRLPTPDGRVKLVVLALNNFESTLSAIQRFKQFGYKGTLAAVARYDDEVERLKEAGADVALNVFAEAGAGLAAHAVGHLGLPEQGPA
ncbi:cation:proton antiporter family protein [Desulfoluna spongiiphila]|uniref:cation:proton antiporter family protein n=1 Tax=Desulfoluna spongiiphila TaxID=419481 RepID=UPI001258CA74|nr:cation:proton antiporter family protein [Desulfoluna spongiiphila]VVS95003.1 cation/h+ exchanger [Desulfoluna spongiiphila]